MLSRILAGTTLAALCALSLGPAPAATRPIPIPTATPLKTIKHVYATRLCTGLRRSIFPAVGRVLDNDRRIAASRPLFQDYVKNTSNASQAGVDMDVLRMEQLIAPLVKNTQAIESLLHDPVYPRKAQSDNDKELLQIRAHLAAVLEEQKRALDLVSGFVDTQQLAELQASGHDYDKAIGAPDTASGRAGSSTSSQKPQTSPTTAPADILNAGITNANNDPARKYDPRFLNTGSQVGYNPLNAFDQAMLEHQTVISQSEDLASQVIFKAVPQCGGHVPAPANPVPASPVSPAPSPAVIVPAPSPSSRP
jgi:hypothetical protein